MSNNIPHTPTVAEVAAIVPPPTPKVFGSVTRWREAQMMKIFPSGNTVGVTRPSFISIASMLSHTWPNCFFLTHDQGANMPELQNKFWKKWTMFRNETGIYKKWNMWKVSESYIDNYI